MQGRYENFPEFAHGVAHFTLGSSMGNIQRIVLSTLYHLNQETLSLNLLAPNRLRDCDVSFELGVAEDNAFHFLDKNELDRFKAINIEELMILDFYLVVRYHTIKKNRRVPLKFDYHLLRFQFQEDYIKIYVYHERGTQRISSEDLITFIAKRINEEFPRKHPRPLNVKYLRTLY